MIPAAPLVGAVTTRPPAAFSSLTASANSVTQSITRSGSVDPGSASRPRRSSAARRRTRSPPGSVPSRRLPRSTHSRITRQISSSPARISASLRQDRSLASMIPLIDSPVSAVRASNSAPVVNGYRTRVVSGLIRSAPLAVSSTTNPPPTE
jgi:hypothetical protein